MTYHLIENKGIAPESLKTTSLQTTLDDFHFEFLNATKVLINHKPIAKKTLKSILFSKYGASLATSVWARQKALGIQQNYSRHQNIVAEGRDTGTIVFPQAKLKFFFVADLDTRVHRVALQLQEPLNKVKQNLIKRDQQDTQRDIAPLAKAADAIEIDTTHLTIQETVDQLYQHYESSRKN